MMEIKGELLAAKATPAARNSYRVKIAGLEWSEESNWTPGRKALGTHQWTSVLPTGKGNFVITVNAAYQQAAIAKLDAQVMASLHTIRLSQIGRAHV